MYFQINNIPTFVHEKRGKKALTTPQSLLTLFGNTIVHDCWTSYFNINTPKHALCGTHMIRELNALEKQGSKWAIWFKTFLFHLLECTKNNIAPYQNQLTPKQQGIASNFYGL